MRGKNKCKILKEIRQKIADENDIPYVTRECTYQGACSGTCPKCEAELRYLEQELEKRRRMGKAVAVAAIAASLALNAGCVPGSSASIEEDPATTVPPLTTEEQLEGEVPELEGDVAYIPEDETRESETEEDSFDFAGGVPLLPEEDPLSTEVPPVETLPVEPESAEPQSNAG